MADLLTIASRQPSQWGLRSVIVEVYALPTPLPHGRTLVVVFSSLYGIVEVNDLVEIVRSSLILIVVSLYVVRIVCIVQIFVVFVGLYLYILVVVFLYMCIFVSLYGLD